MAKEHCLRCCTAGMVLPSMRKGRFIFQTVGKCTIAPIERQVHIELVVQPASLPASSWDVHTCQRRWTLLRCSLPSNNSEDWCSEDSPAALQALPAIQNLQRMWVMVACDSAETAAAYLQVTARLSY